MKNHLFRGKRNDGQWMFGDLFVQAEGTEYEEVFILGYLDHRDCICDVRKCAEKVEPRTVGQFTGLFDKNDHRIFEGDIVKTKYGRLCIVVWFASQVYNGWDLEAVRTSENLANTKPPEPVDLYKSDNLEIIGNIYDNPEPTVINY